VAAAREAQLSRGSDVLRQRNDARVTVRHPAQRPRDQEPIHTMTQTISPAEALALQALVTPTEQGIASRVLARNTGGNVTLFAFDKGQGLTEHTSPFEALVLVLEGSLTLTVGGVSVRATPGTIVRMPATVPHAVEAPEAARMLLVMLRDRKDG
jgi:quercetin dioxygenase-like cupin family protein